MEEKISKKIHDRSLLYQDTSLNTPYRYTIKENILFGREFDEPLYNKVIQMSCLDADLEILEKRDDTIVG